MKRCNNKMMRRTLLYGTTLSLLCLLTPLATAQVYDIGWWTIDGGGDMFNTTGGGYDLCGTIGQHDAGTTMSGGGFELSGGFWFGGGAAPPVPCPGDSNCDDTISWRDIDYFVAAQNDNVAAWEAMFLPGTPTCPFENNDVNEDGTANWRDIDPFVAVMNTTCP